MPFWDEVMAFADERGGLRCGGRLLQVFLYERVI